LQQVKKNSLTGIHKKGVARRSVAVRFDLRKRALHGRDIGRWHLFWVNLVTFEAQALGRSGISLMAQITRVGLNLLGCLLLSPTPPCGRVRAEPRSTITIFVLALIRLELPIAVARPRVGRDLNVVSTGGLGCRASAIVCAHRSDAAHRLGRHMAVIGAPLVSSHHRRSCRRVTSSRYTTSEVF
jgi:hypothetical protein